jgi:hypothetical protein
MLDKRLDVLMSNMLNVFIRTSGGMDSVKTFLVVLMVSGRGLKSEKGEQQWEKVEELHFGFCCGDCGK